VRFNRLFLWMMAVMVSLAIAPAAVQATDLTVSDGDSSINVDPHSDDGFDTWTVDGTDHMYQQWFWFRLDSEGGGEVSLDEVPLLHHETHSTDTIHLTYGVDAENITATADILYVLEDGANGSSRVSEWVTLSGTGIEENDTFHWFEYTDLDLDGSSGDSAERTGPGVIVQTDSPFSVTVESDVVPTHWEIDVYSDLVDALDDGDPTTLADATSPFGPADATHAFQWSIPLTPGNAFFQYHKEKTLGRFAQEPNVIPEPSSMLLFGLGGAAAWFKRRRSKKA